MGSWVIYGVKECVESVKYGSQGCMGLKTLVGTSNVWFCNSIVVFTTN